MSILNRRKAIRDRLAERTESTDTTDGYPAEHVRSSSDESPTWAPERPRASHRAQVAEIMAAPLSE